MAIQLPRFSSRALPTEEVLSPQEAAEATAVQERFIGAVSGKVAEFAQSMYYADQNQKKGLAVAQTQSEMDAITLDPKYDQLYEEQTDFQGRPIVDDAGDPVRRPMEEILAEDFAAFEQRAMSRLDKIGSRKVRAEAQAEISEIVNEARLKAFQRANEIMVTRAKATGLETGNLLEERGQWDAARAHYREMLSDGLLTPTQLDNNLDRVTERQAEFPYVNALLLDNPQLVEEAMVAAANDTALGGKQTEWVKSLRSHYDSLQSDQDNAQKIRQQENSVRMWAELPNLTVPQIERLDVPYNQKIAAIKAKRAGTSATGVESNPQTLEGLDALLNRWTVNPNDESLDSVLRAIGREADEGRITQDDARTLMNEALTLHNRLYQDTGFAKIDTLISQRITGSPADEILYDRFEDRRRADLILDYRNQIRQEYIGLARTDPTFDLWEWWGENEQRVLEGVKELTAVPPSNANLKTLVLQGDYAGAMSLINGATYTNEADKRIAINRVNAWNEEYNAGTLQ